MIFVTGSNGFIGKVLVNRLKREGRKFIAGNRQLYGNIEDQMHWESLLKDCKVVVHLAARVHIMNDIGKNAIKEFRHLNVEASASLAKAAKTVGVKRFIYLSSVKVNGEETFEKAFSSLDKPKPEDAYGQSKMEAEIELMKLHEIGVFEVVIIRPPLVYGIGVKANFEKLFSVVKSGFPLPFGQVQNKRSMVSVLNLVDLIICCVDHPKAGGEIFMVSDDCNYSLKSLIELIAKVQNSRPFLIPIPLSLLRFGLNIIGKTNYNRRLFGNLQVDISKTKEVLNWSPPYTFEETYQKNQ